MFSKFVLTRVSKRICHTFSRYASRVCGCRLSQTKKIYRVHWLAIFFLFYCIRSFFFLIYLYFPYCLNHLTWLKSSDLYKAFPLYILMYTKSLVQSKFRNIRSCITYYWLYSIYSLCELKIVNRWKDLFKVPAHILRNLFWKIRRHLGLVILFIHIYNKYWAVFLVTANYYSVFWKKIYYYCMPLL